MLNPIGSGWSLSESGSSRRKQGLWKHLPTDANSFYSSSWFPGHQEVSSFLCPVLSHLRPHTKWLRAEVAKAVSLLLSGAFQASVISVMGNRLAQRGIKWAQEERKGSQVSSPWLLKNVLKIRRLFSCLSATVPWGWRNLPPSLRHFPIVERTRGSWGTVRKGGCRGS